MQTAAPEASTSSTETDETLALYGLPRGSTQGFAWQCLVARRLAERGVRFIELIDSGSSNNWDAHGDMIRSTRPLAKQRRSAHRRLCSTDLKRRGLLDDTLVVWTTEFGRTPFNNSADAKGREHHPLGVLLLAGRRRRQGAASSYGAPTSTASASPRTPSTSTTSTPRSCTCWASITRSSPTGTPAATSG